MDGLLEVQFENPLTTLFPVNQAWKSTLFSLLNPIQGSSPLKELQRNERLWLICVSSFSLLMVQLLLSSDHNCYLPFSGSNFHLTFFIIYFIAHLASQNTHWTCVRLLDNWICAVCSLWLRYLCFKKTGNDCHSTIVNALGFCKQDLLDKYYTKHFFILKITFLWHFHC